MKKLFLIIPLITTSIYTSAHALECVGPLFSSSPNPKIQFAPYIYQILNRDVGRDIGAFRLMILQKLIGIRVEGWHRSYPEGTTYKTRTKVTGVVQNVELIKPGNTGEEVYEMTIHSEENGQQKFLISGSYSPFFSSLETTDLPPRNQLAVNALEAEKTVELPFDILSVGLDTPPEVAAYKENLRAQGAVVFYGKRYPFYEFANFYETAPIVIDGEIWASTEHYFQAQKFVYPDGRNNEYVMSIRMARSPAEAARMGRDRSYPIRPDWENVKDKIMFKALAAKFTQYKHLYDLLMSTGDALIVEHTERDRYWGDGENGRGKSMLGHLLMKLRDQLKEGIVPNYEHPQVVRHPNQAHDEQVPAYALSIADAWNNQLPVDIQNLDPQNTHGTYGLIEQIAFSNISDIEKMDRMQMVLHLVQFFTRTRSEDHTSVRNRKWMIFINTKYPKDADFRYQLVKFSVLLAGSDVVTTDLYNLRISHEQKIEIYRLMARGSADTFMRTLPQLRLDHSDIRRLYLYALQFEASVYVVRELPPQIVNDAFIQEVASTINEHNFPTQRDLVRRNPRLWRRSVIQQLTAAADHYGLTVNFQFDESNGE